VSLVIDAAMLERTLYPAKLVYKYTASLVLRNSKVLAIQGFVSILLAHLVLYAKDCAAVLILEAPRATGSSTVIVGARSLVSKATKFGAAREFAKVLL